MDLARVSVVVPAYNASATIDETILSVRAQTLSDIEVVVVDDGSNDATADIIRKHAELDGRIRLISTKNGGVARARNVGIAAARTDLIAPIDADDLWHPRKLELQFAALNKAPEGTALVYCWFVIIDELGRIIGYGSRDESRGDVLRRMCLRNLVGNGSGPLMRKAAVLEAGGYDPGLRDQNAQGCEDLKLYFAIAERHRFELVPCDLLGYRATMASMSSDGARMLRSYDLVMLPAQHRHIDFRREFREGRTHLVRWLLERAINYGTANQARQMWLELYRQSPYAALSILPKGGALLRRRYFSPPPRLRFEDLPGCASGLDPL